MAEKHKEIDEFGNVYKGEIYNGKWHGSGTLLYADTGDVYHGDFENGVPHGSGKYLRDGGKNGQKDGVFEGLWHNGVLQQVKKGRAKITLDNGDVYDGGFHHWKMHGMGKLIQNNGEIYVGQWKEGMRHGPGKITYPDGAFYEGHFRHDEAIVNAGEDKQTYATQELELNPYQLSDEKQNHGNKRSDPSPKGTVGVPRTISFQSQRSRVGNRDNEEVSSGEEPAIRDSSRGNIRKENDTSDILEMKRLQLERLKDGKCLRKYAEKNVTKLERKQSKQGDSEKKGVFSLFRSRKKKKDETKATSATDQFVDNIPEFFDIEVASGVWPSPYQERNQNRLSTPRVGRRSKSPFPRSSSKSSLRSQQQQTDEYQTPNRRSSPNRLPSKPQIRSESRTQSRTRYEEAVDHPRALSRGRSRSAPRESRDVIQSSTRERSSSRAQERSLSAPRQPYEINHSSPRGRSSSRARGRELSAPRQLRADDQYANPERSSSRARGRERSAPRKLRADDQYANPERSSSRARGRSLSTPRDDAPKSASDRYSSRSRGRTPSRSRPAHDNVHSSRELSSPRTSRRSSSNVRPSQEKGGLSRSRTNERKEKPLLDSRARKEALLKKYNIPNHLSTISGGKEIDFDSKKAKSSHGYPKESVHSRRSQRSDHHGLKSINMKGRSGTAQMLYVNQVSDDDSEYFMK